MKLFGLDLSKHNGNIDFQSIKNAGNSFVILRAGYGVSTKDPMFETYYSQAKSVGLDVGAYWYSYALNESAAIQEAKMCLSVIAGKQFEYPIYIDMEDADGYKAKHGMPSNAMLVKICQDFCATVEKENYYVGIYASESWFKNQLSALDNRYDKWVANWGSNNGQLQSDKSQTYRLHQFTSQYLINGKRYDRNVCYIDYPSIIKDHELNGVKNEQKSTAEIVNEVIQGLWGNGEERKQRLTQAGYDYQTIQNQVNTQLSKKELKVGDRVKVKSSATVYVTGQKIPSYVKNTTYTIMQIKTDSVLLKEIMSWVYKKDIQ